MAWVVDTSVLLDIHVDDPTFGNRSGQCLLRYLPDGLVICPVSYVELAPAFSGDGSLQQAFLQEAGVDWLQPWTSLDAAASYQLVGEPYCKEAGRTCEQKTRRRYINRRFRAAFSGHNHAQPETLQFCCYHRSVAGVNAIGFVWIISVSVHFETQ